jgi:hypothetical protein
VAYRFTGASSSRVQFGIGPFNGYTFGAFTIAAFFKRASTADNPAFVFFSNAAGGSNKLELMALSSGGGLRVGLAPLEYHGYAVFADTANWWLLVATCAGAGQPVRFHLHDGTSWMHGAQSNGTSPSFGGVAIGATDTLFVSAPLAWGGEYMNGDMVCAGVKKADSTDLQVEALSRTLFSAWTGFGFDWLAEFSAAGSPIINRANPGSGDEVARTAVSLVADPPGWVGTPPGYSSYTTPSAESIARTFNAYSPAGDSLVRYQGATPTDLAEAVWFSAAYVGAGVSGSGGGGGVSIYSGSVSGA